ncbi:MAG: hypothetical protein HYY23_14720, partial [Verrucomicrobia bacterium]|nr:hypothetical protein [Verrucomicrobiota bacterium]
MKTPRGFCLIVAILCLASGARPGLSAQLPTQLPPHPRLLFTPQDIPDIKQRIATQPWAKARFAALKAQADAWLDRE